MPLQNWAYDQHALAPFRFYAMVSGEPLEYCESGLTLADLDAGEAYGVKQYPRTERWVEGRDGRLTDREIVTMLAGIYVDWC